MLHGDVGRDRRPGTAVLIHVTQEDLDGGEIQNAWKCAIARALGRTWEGASVSVTPGRVTVAGCLWALPTQAKQFIGLYDAGARVEPFSFLMMPVLEQAPVSV